LNHLTLDYFVAGLVAGTAAFSSLAGVLFAGLAVSFLASALTGAAGAVCAKADTANMVATSAITDFILDFLLG
jgi:hypothetical protein